jgi:hypothetical protein
MALVIIRTNDDELVGVIEITNTNGPWTDDWQGGDESEFADLVNQALALEGDTA